MKSKKIKKSKKDKLIVSDFELDMGMLGEQLVDVYGIKTVDSPDPELDLGYSVNIAITYLVMTNEHGDEICIGASMLSKADRQYFESTLEESIEERLNDYEANAERLGEAKWEFQHR